MNKHSMKKLLSLVLCAVLIAAMALSFTGCSDDKETEEPQTSGTLTDGETLGKETEELQSPGTFTDGQILGEGGTEFTLTVVDAEGNKATTTIHTDKTILGDALLELNLIAGDTSEYGLYIKTVNGITYDYNTDGKYWALYIGEEYAMTGIDSTEITPNAAYTLKAE